MGLISGFIQILCVYVSGTLIGGGCVHLPLVLFAQVGFSIDQDLDLLPFDSVNDEVWITIHSGGKKWKRL